MLSPDCHSDIVYFTKTLLFKLMHDVRVAPLRSARCLSRPALVVTICCLRQPLRAAKKQIGRRGGKRVMFFVQANNFERPYSLMRQDTVDLQKLLSSNAYEKVVKLKNILAYFRNL